jgi:hypothetical protein
MYSFTFSTGSSLSTPLSTSTSSALTSSASTSTALLSTSLSSASCLLKRDLAIAELTKKNNKLKNKIIFKNIYCIIK